MRLRQLEKQILKLKLHPTTLAKIPTPRPIQPIQPVQRPIKRPIQYEEPVQRPIQLMKSIKDVRNEL